MALNFRSGGGDFNREGREIAALQKQHLVLIVEPTPISLVNSLLCTNREFYQHLKLHVLNYKNLTLFLALGQYQTRTIAINSR